jgi:hypothetical protein
MSAIQRTIMTPPRAVYTEPTRSATAASIGALGTQVSMAARGVASDAPRGADQTTSAGVSGENGGRSALESGW